MLDVALSSMPLFFTASYLAFQYTHHFRSADSGLWRSFLLVLRTYNDRLSHPAFHPAAKMAILNGQLPSSGSQV